MTMLGVGEFSVVNLYVTWFIVNHYVVGS